MRVNRTMDNFAFLFSLLLIGTTSAADPVSNTLVDTLTIEIESLRNQVDKLGNEIRSLHAQQAKNTSVLDAVVQSQQPKRILVTGGAGFVGSHLVDRLLAQGHEVTVVDNFMTGRRQNLRHHHGNENLEVLHHDVERPLYFEVDEIYHLASPASPPHYMRDPVKTIKTNAIGTLNVLGLAKRLKARVLIASTSEVYGDPLQHPQPESYWGNVNSYGPRSCYDEGKRVAEALAFAYNVNHGLDVKVARIFNTYGPRMHSKDGRVVSNFITQAIQERPLTVYGSGAQTRSFQYISDLVDGLTRLMNSNISQPVNLGNPDEYQINDFAQLVLKMTRSSSPLLHLPAVVDDPQVRRPDISKAKRLLDWSPRVPLERGLADTIEYFRREIK